MPKLREHPPTRDELSAAYGFTVPEAFARLMAAFHARAGGSCDALIDHEMLSWWPAGRALEAMVDGEHPGWGQRYCNTPPEFMSFGDMGVDGAQYGYIVHAPELNAAEYPVAHFCTMDFSHGASKLGHDTTDAVRRMLADQWPWLVEHEDAADPRPHAEFAAAAGVEWSPDLDLKRLWTKDARPEDVPNGWIWVPTLDRIGVLAPCDKFRDEGRGLTAWVDGLPFPPTDTELCKAQRDLADGFPASALHRLRELWRARSPHALMAEAYEELGRPLLARIMMEHVL